MSARSSQSLEKAWIDIKRVNPTAETNREGKAVAYTLAEVLALTSISELNSKLSQLALSESEMGEIKNNLIAVHDKIVEHSAKRAVNLLQ